MLSTQYTPFKTMIAYATVGVLVLSAGCSSMGTSTKKAKKLLGAEKTEQAYYQSAQRLMDRQQFESAALDLRSLETYYPTGKYTEQAQLDLIYSQYRQGDFTAVVTGAERFIRLYPRNAQLDYAWYLSGLASMASGNNTFLTLARQDMAERDLQFSINAFKQFSTLIQRYPNSQFNVDAQQRMIFLRNRLAQSELKVAEFNFRREAYLGAIQRANVILAQYPTAPQIKDALSILSRSYVALGDNTQAKLYDDLLAVNFPETQTGLLGLKNKVIKTTDKLVNNP